MPLRRTPEQPPKRTLERPPEQASQPSLRLISESVPRPVSQPLTHPLPRRESPDDPPQAPKRTPQRKPRRRSFSRKKIYRRRRRAALAIICVFVLAIVWMLLPSGETNSPEAVDTAGPVRAPVGGSAMEEPARSAGKYVVSAEGSKESNGEKAMPPPPVDKTLYLTVPKMGRYEDVVRNDDSAWALDNGAIKLPSTGFPWQPNANTYIAGHVLGYADTGSYMQFAELPNMVKGDEIFLTDANGTTYKYRVTEILTVTPQDNWVTNPVAGKDMVTLQTCVNPPDYDQRLIVRGERVSVKTL